jgi:hypothetical protein
VTIVHPVLDPSRHVVEQRVREARDVAARHDVRASLDPQQVVAEHSVGQVQAVALEPLRVGRAADRLDHHVGRELGAVVQLHGGDAVRAAEADRQRAEVEAHAARPA